MVDFDPTTHRYTHQGRVIPSVTARITAAGLLGPAAAFYTDAAAARGQHVHRACLLLDGVAQFRTPREVFVDGCLITSGWGDADTVTSIIETAAPTLTPTERNFVLSYQRWCVAMTPDWTSMETPHYSARYDTAGTADRLGTIDSVPAVVDFKTGGPAAWHGVQLAMYDLLHDELPPRERRRLVLHLVDDGRMAQVVEYHAAADYLLALELMKGSSNVTHCTDHCPDAPAPHCQL
jgi:hypothetical protein